MSIYQKEGSKYFWYRFTYRGKRYQRSTKVENKREAGNIEKAAWTQLARAEVGIEEKPKKERVTVGVLLDRLKEHYQSERKDSPQNLSTLAQAREAFENRMADELTEAHIEDHIAAQQRKDKKPATINRVLEIVRRAYRIAKVASPEIRHLREDNTRTGFFSCDELERVVEGLPEDLRDFVRFAFATAWRKNEVASLKWSDVEDEVIRLRAANSKSREARQVVIAGDITEIIRRRRALRAVETSDGTILSEHIFHRDGAPVKQFGKSWARACCAAKVGTMYCEKCVTESDELKCCKRPTKYRGKIFHDLRRSGVRDMIRSGTPQSVAMKISGHKTASMFRRYDISSESDLRAAALNLQKSREAERQKLVSMEPSVQGGSAASGR